MCGGRRGLGIWSVSDISGSLELFLLSLRSFSAGCNVSSLLEHSVVPFSILCLKELADPWKGVQGTSSSCCRGFFVPHDPASPKPALLSASSLAQEQILLLHWGDTVRGHPFPSAGSLDPPVRLAAVSRGPKRGQTKKIPQVHSQSQQRLDQDSKTLPAAFEGRDEQAPMQEFLQQPEKQHDNTRIQWFFNKKTWTP